MNPKKENPVFSKTDATPVEISNEEWKDILPEEVYHIAREKGTEMPGTGKYFKHNEAGTYYCAACGNPLFKSDGKFNSSCGWPSFLNRSAKAALFICLIILLE